jgi:DNA-binding GntR family transcriptional regulator
VGEHLAIIKALRADRPDHAAEAMRSHIRSAASHAADALSLRLNASAA